MLAPSLRLLLQQRKRQGVLATWLRLFFFDSVVWCGVAVVGRLGAAFAGKGDLNLGVHFVDCQAEQDNEKEALLPVGWGMRDEKCTVQSS